MLTKVTADTITEEQIRKLMRTRKTSDLESDELYRLAMSPDPHGDGCATCRERRKARARCAGLFNKMTGSAK